MSDYWPIFGWTFLGMLVGFLVRPIFEGYAKRSGELLAEHRLAAEVELEKARGRQSVDQQNEAHKADLSMKNQLRLAGLDRRLLAHQEAYEKWTMLTRHIGSPKLPQAVAECQEWWVKNCLYLSSAARVDFANAIRAAGTQDLLHLRIKNRDDFDRVWGEYDDLLNAPGASIVASVDLPPISADVLTREDVESPAARNCLQS